MAMGKWLRMGHPHSSTVSTKGGVNKIVKRAPRCLVFSETGTAHLTVARPRVATVDSSVSQVEQSVSGCCERVDQGHNQVVLTAAQHDRAASGQAPSDNATLAEMMRLPRSRPIRETFASDKDWQRAVRMREVKQLMEVMPESM
eukprot:6214066-Pleurochrysis_carterae.AAC.1